MYANALSVPGTNAGTPNLNDAFSQKRYQKMRDMKDNEQVPFRQWLTFIFSGNPCLKCGCHACDLLTRGIVVE